MAQIAEPGSRIRDFTDLRAWQQSHRLVLETYRLTKQFPKEEVFGIVSQMRRAAVSVTSNIAEGFGRQGYKEKTQFYYLAQGSLIELKNQLIVCRDIKYISQQEFEKVSELSNHAHRLLQGLIQKTKMLSHR
jgi:four helix bundle protein